MKCSNCGKDCGTIFRCGNCGDVKCVKCPSKQNIPGNYHQFSCMACKKKGTVKRIS